MAFKGGRVDGGSSDVRMPFRVYDLKDSSLVLLESSSPETILIPR